MSVYGKNRHQRHKHILATSLLTLLFFSCITKPDVVDTPPPSPDEHCMVIERTIYTHGNPLDFDIANQTLFVAEDQVAFTLYKKDGSLIYHRDQHDTGQYWTETTLCRFYPSLNIILVYDRSIDHRFYLFSYDENNTTTPVTAISSPPPSYTSGIRDLVADPVPISSNRFRIFYSFYDGSTTRLNKAVFEIGASTNLTYENQIDLEGPLYNLTLHGDYIVTASGTRGILVFDSTLDNTYTCSTPQNARAVKIKGNILYVADYAGLCLIDISDITNPILLQTHALSARATTIDIDTTQTFLAIGSNNGGGLYLFDISDPTHPNQIDHLPRKSIGSTINKVMFSDNELYVASKELGIVAISYSLPEAR